MQLFGTNFFIRIDILRPFQTLLFSQRPYHAEYTSSRPITEVKQRRDQSVLGWVTAWEHWLLLANLFSSSFWQKPQRQTSTKQRKSKYDFLNFFQQDTRVTELIQAHISKSPQIEVHVWSGESFFRTLLRQKSSLGALMDPVRGPMGSLTNFGPLFSL